MTQPSLHLTFDTSLIDLGSQTHTLTSSFSTTDTDPATEPDDQHQPPPPTSPSLSDNPLPHTLQPVSPSNPRETNYTTTHSLYNAWAPTYDTTPNILQAVDDLELETLLPEFLDLIPVPSSTTANANANANAASCRNNPLRLLDLGCGTGRNTTKLLAHDWSTKNVEAVEVVGVDASPAMLSVARRKLSRFLPRGGSGNAVESATFSPFTASAEVRVNLRLVRRDVFNPDADDGGWDGDGMPEAGTVHAVVSTLVVEHVPLEVFFGTVRRLLVRGGVVLLTGMHEDMGGRGEGGTGAGFVRGGRDGDGVKVRGESFVHGVGEVVGEAEKWGFSVVGGVREGVVEGERMREMGIGEKWEKWVGWRVWFGIVFKKVR
ncbi:S-adenosyl-L-methionine-dependent methyltransferase [Saccharata proteae CBS 121410]|uniref:S-adenosyl-L-methionine-dependent methyltransferase n=1 Tax=Saccharata proteae CBS 121410 TaxID=1314787 RepID=A0A9P4HZ32_9PEZI|nr:S-adenosyl-L-methionine-dependent methyltransferase [Saccharata proteae CBS 121410]